MKVFAPSRPAFRPCAMITMLGSYVMGIGGTYSVERMNFTPGRRDPLNPSPTARSASRVAIEALALGILSRLIILE